MSTRTLKRVKKPYRYVVLGAKKQLLGGSKTLRGAMRIAGKRKNVGIARIDRAWARGKPKRSRRKKGKK